MSPAGKATVALLCLSGLLFMAALFPSKAAVVMLAFLGAVAVLALWCALYILCGGE